MKMLNQMRVENYKFVRSVFFWLALLFMIVVGTYNGYKWDASAQIKDMNLPFEQALPDMSFVFMPALFTAWFIGYSFSTRTILLEIATGASRFSVILARFFPVIVSGILFHGSYLFFTELSLGLKIGFESFELSNIHWAWIGTVLLQIIALECFFILIGFLCCNLYVGLVVSVISAFTLVNIFRNIFRNALWYKYSFFHFVESAEYSEMRICCVVALLSIVPLVSLTYQAFRKREI